LLSLVLSYNPFAFSSSLGCFLILLVATWMHPLFSTKFRPGLNRAQLTTRVISNEEEFLSVTGDRLMYIRSE